MKPRLLALVVCTLAALALTGCSPDHSGDTQVMAPNPPGTKSPADQQIANLPPQAQEAIKRAGPRGK